MLDRRAFFATLVGGVAAAAIAGSKVAEAAPLVAETLTPAPAATSAEPAAAEPVEMHGQRHGHRHGHRHHRHRHHRHRHHRHHRRHRH